MPHGRAFIVKKPKLFTTNVLPRFRGFTSKYRVHKLVYFEQFGEITDAIAREKAIKGGSRKKKLALIASMNPQWRDMADDDW